MIFPCVSCGCCCSKVDVAVKNLEPYSLDKNNDLFFPYKWDDTGRCENLTFDNKCSIYENRPTMCNIQKMKDYFNLPEKDYYDLTISCCNILMDEANLPIELRIKN